jgi:hypothetical protein
LITRFHEFGDIRDVKMADSILWQVNKTYNSTLASPYIALTSSAMLQHHFAQSDTLLQKAQKIGMDGFTNTTLSFDVNFELGRYFNAGIYLRKMRSAQDYNYYFRKSKYDHFNGTIDSAIASMQKAADKANTEPYLQAVALSNVADLNIHAGNLERAAGLGWITLIHDKNYALAERIFKFVQSKNQLPDPLFKLYQCAQGRGDTVLEKKYATQFTDAAANPLYGRMYNKYTIEIYTGILHNPAKAEMLAKDELNNRATPQTYAWYAYTLVVNGKKDEAYKVFQQHVSGQPLEGLELYYMGKLMKGLEKGYNANEFFKAADKNIYDLSPDMAKDLKANLEE